MSAVARELATLRELYRTLQNCSQDLQRVSDDIDGALGENVWTGAKAEQFRTDWDSVKPTLTPELVDALNEAKEDIKVQHNNLAAATGELDSL